MSKGYSSQEYECLFDVDNQISIAEMLRNDAVLRYRTRTITCGKMVECEIYPIWKRRPEVQKARQFVTSEAQKKVNDRNAKKKLIRKLNTNFDENDVVCHLTYEETPPDMVQAKKDIQNYIRRVRDYRKKNNMTEFKYLYVIEYDDGQSREKTKRIHQHIVMSGMDRDIAEKLWTNGIANCDRLKPDEYGLEALGRYMTKDPKGYKRWAGSKNLAEFTKESVADHKITVRKIERIATQFDEQAGKIFAKEFPACKVLSIEVKRSDHVAGAYVYAKMNKSDPKPREKRRHVGY